MVLLTNLASPSPQLIHTLCRTTSVPAVLNTNPHSLYVLVGGFGDFTTTPLRTSTYAVVPVLYSPTDVVASPDTTSCAAPVRLSVWVLPVSVPYVPVTVSSIEFPIFASVKIPFPQRVEVDPANTDVADHVFCTMSLQGRV